MLSKCKPMRGQKEVLAQKLGRIVLPFFFKENVKEVQAGYDISHTNFDVTKPKKRIISGIKILKKESNAKTKQKKTASTKKVTRIAVTCAVKCMWIPMCEQKG